MHLKVLHREIKADMQHRMKNDPPRTPRTHLGRSECWQENNYKVILFCNNNFFNDSVMKQNYYGITNNYIIITNAYVR